jgi:hypothetical protein
MGRPKKSAESLENEFWDVFARWDLAEQKVILRVNDPACAGARKG